MMSPLLIFAALLALAPFLLEAFCTGFLSRLAHTVSFPLRMALPALLCIPYTLVAYSSRTFHWSWFALYALLPVAVAFLLWQSQAVDPIQNGNWRDFLVLLILGLAVDLRWFEAAWPAKLTVFGKVLLLDAGIYGFCGLRQLGGTGFDLRLKFRDLRFGLREFLFYTPIAIPLGLGLHFLHFHSQWPSLLQAAGGFLFIFFFIAIPEELFFRGWMQNLLERHTGRYTSLLVTAALFGLSHWNKRALHFNWRYVLLATLAGFFYGRAWRQERRVGASSITHATVDTVWSLWLR